MNAPAGANTTLSGLTLRAFPLGNVSSYYIIEANPDSSVENFIYFIV